MSKDALPDIEDAIVAPFMKPNEEFQYNDAIDMELPKPLKFEQNQVTVRAYVKDLCDSDISTKEKVKKIKIELSRKHHLMPSNANLLYTYRSMILDGTIEANHDFERLFKGHSYRENSGVMVITVVTSPTPKGQDFSCKYDCHYCPSEPAHAGNGFQNQPRSYIFNEPGVRRANRNKFDAVLQLRDRARSYIINGLPVDKIEIIILGGTWHSYPEDYREEFVRDLFYAANTLWDSDFNENPRAKYDIKEEQRINETDKSRIIGVTIETRPDQINSKSVVELRRLGVTRVQLGVQHIDDNILKIINRQCKTRTVIRAIKLLKDSCFKVDIHLMPDLPGSDYGKDMEMFKYVLGSPDIQADQWKIYPCMTIPWTEIKRWYDIGEYKPYAESMVEMDNGDGVIKMVNPLMELIIRVKSMCHPWIRLNRIIRDIPDEYMINLKEIQEKDISAFSNMRQFVQDRMKSRGLACRCIRCREVKGKKVVNLEEAEVVIRTYDASDGIEYFLSFESKDRETLYGFLRLRLSDMVGRYKNKVVFEELVGSALIRELHVYGSVVEVDKNREDGVQHYGFGSRLIQRAEEIAIGHGFRKISVISGVGVREYYRKKGYMDGDYFLNKRLDAKLYRSYKFIIPCVIVIIGIFYFLYNIV